MVKLIEINLEGVEDLLTIADTDVSSEHKVGDFNLKEVASEDLIKQSNIFSGRAKEAVSSQGADSEEAQIAQTMAGAIDFISHARINGKSVDITATKYVSAVNNAGDNVSLSIRLTANPDTRSGNKVGIATRTRDGGKSKAVPQMVVVVTGLSDTQLEILKTFLDLCEGVRNVVLGSSYASLDSKAAKDAYLNNYKYRFAKEKIYNGRVRNNTEDLTVRYNTLTGAYVYQEVGEHSLDISSYATFSTPSLDAPSDFGNVMENEEGLKKIKEVDLGKGKRVFTRTCPDFVRPLKANYINELKPEVEKIASDIQMLQALVLNCIAVEEAAFTQIKPNVSFNEEAVLEILKDNLSTISKHELSTVSGLEKKIGVTETDKIVAKGEAAEQVNKAMELDVMKNLTSFEGMKG